MMIRCQGIADKYTLESHTDFGNTKQQGVYRNSKYVFCLLLLATLFGCTENKLSARSAETDMPDLCELPEDISAFGALIRDKVGEEISGSDIKLLKKEMEVVREREVMDIFYSMSENVRYVFLRKKCIALDKVPYEFNLGVIINLAGNPIFNQALLIYQKEDVLNGKRKFSFENIAGSGEDYTELVSKNTVGVMDKTELEEYMQSLGCSEVAMDKKIFTMFSMFSCKIEPEKDLLSRLFTYDFSKLILVDFDAAGIVKEISVKF